MFYNKCCTALTKTKQEQLMTTCHSLLHEACLAQLGSQLIILECCDARLSNRKKTGTRKWSNTQRQN